MESCKHDYHCAHVAAEQRQDAMKIQALSKELMELERQIPEDLARRIYYKREEINRLNLKWI